MSANVCVTRRNNEVKKEVYKSPYRPGQTLRVSAGSGSQISKQ
jgi:hypothetical protein